MHNLGRGSASNGTRISNIQYVNDRSGTKHYSPESVAGQRVDCPSPSEIFVLLILYHVLAYWLCNQKNKKVIKYKIIIGTFFFYTPKSPPWRSSRSAPAWTADAIVLCLRRSLYDGFEIITGDRRFVHTGQSGNGIIN